MGVERLARSYSNPSLWGENVVALEIYLDKGMITSTVLIK